MDDIRGGRHGYPTDGVDYFGALGMNVFRLPFLWERLQHEPGGPLDGAELAQIDAFVEYATERGAQVIIEPHNFARYTRVSDDGVVGSPALLGSDELPMETLADFWSKLARHYDDNERVVFGLMNEPNGMPTEQWRDAANIAIAAIRGANADNLILAPGNDFTAGHTWTTGDDGHTPNSEVMDEIVDPLDRFYFQIHQYATPDPDARSYTCYVAGPGEPRLGERAFGAVTEWMRARGRQVFLAEIGGSSDPSCLAAVDELLTFIESNADVWVGWAWWVAGVGSEDQAASIWPADAEQRPQLEVLRRHIGHADGP